MPDPTGCPQELRHALDSPVPSIRTPFTKDGAVDLDGVRAQVDFAIAGKARTLMVTWGDSLFSVQTDKQIAELVKVVVEHSNGRAKVIAADNSWATPKAVAFAEYCSEIGADLLMLLPPDWAASTTTDNLVEHFNAVGQHLPTMIVTAFFTTMGPRPPGRQMEILKALYERAPNLVAVKDDVLGEAGNRMCMLVHPRWAVVSGGLMANHTLQVPYGVDGYLCLIMSFRPDIAWEYFNSIKEENYANAWRIMRDIEYPLRDAMNAAHPNMNAVWHGMSELFGISNRHLPLPYHTLTDEQMDVLAQGLKDLKFLP